MWSLHWPQPQQLNNIAVLFPLLSRFSLLNCRNNFLFKLNNFHVFFFISKDKKKGKENTMGDNLRRSFPFPDPSSDPQACVSELTRTNSDSSGSGVAIESFRDPTANARLGQTMVWTNEKHSSYLEFLEASFVKQLHCSMSLRGCHPREEIWEPCPTPQLPAKGHNYSHQLLDLQDCCCHKINCESKDPLESTADSSDISRSPWLHHFMSSGKSSSATFPVPRETAVSSDGIYLRSNTNLGGCTTDQNFVDEDQRENTSCVTGAKRLKMVTMLDASSNSQVVPLGKLNSVDDAIISNTSAKRGNKKSLSKHPESFICRKSDIRHFLRES
ncbi:uncharacterized protein LOC111296208 isoform X2 [Durio zibethinus]|uniref:Uncharacterized protein LOC111296208 isoform X2 n=1 Tax=Durio zibethinus TaxID=66656 RepID=A0A6P5Z1B8_DURZI|nr:uncharacterized protein LOC111296208 isoform X2 [Durio zibethinus]